MKARGSWAPAAYVVFVSYRAVIVEVQLINMKTTNPEAPTNGKSQADISRNPETANAHSPAGTPPERRR